MTPESFAVGGLFAVAGALAERLASVWPADEAQGRSFGLRTVLLAVVPLLRRLSNRALLAGAALAFVVPSVVAALVNNNRLRAGVQPTSYGDLLDVGSLTQTLFWTGAYLIDGLAELLDY